MSTRIAIFHVYRAASDSGRLTFRRYAIVIDSKEQRDSKVTLNYTDRNVLALFAPEVNLPA